MKNKLKKIIKFGFWLATYLVIFILGFYAAKSESFNAALGKLSQLKNFSYSKYKAGSDVETKAVELIIPDSSMTIIEMNRNNGMKTGILHDTDKVEVPGTLVYLNDSFNIDLRLKGDYSDHWSGDKWSYRIKMKGEERLFGMKSFSIQDPITRGNLNEWYFHKLLAYEGLIALRYKFIEVIQNGVSKGIYAVEESFDKNLIEANNRREAPILKFDESILINKDVINSTNTYSQEELFLISKIDVFGAKRTLKDSVLYDQFLKGKLLLEKLRAREIELGDAIDVDKAARLFAIADLTGGHHALRWKNVRFYFNPVTSKLELIAFDSNNGKLIEDIFYNFWKNRQMGDFHVFAWKDIFFSDENFVKIYFETLERISNPDYLKNFDQSIATEMNQNLALLYKENSFYRFLKEHYEANARLIATKIQAYKVELNPENKEYLVEVSAYEPFLLNQDSIQIVVRNKSHKKVLILGAFNKHEDKISLNETIILDEKSIGETGKDYWLSIPLSKQLDSSKVKVKRKESQWVYKKIKIGYQFEGQTDTNYTKIGTPITSIIETKKNLNFEFITIDKAAKRVTIAEGNWLINESITFPKDFSLTCSGNTSIDLRNHAIITVNGPLELIGNDNNPITIYSSDSSGSFLVYQASKMSYVKNVIFKGLSEIHQAERHLTGGVNFYEADVELFNVTFLNNNSEDALNIFRSNFKLENAVFKNVKSDAFDGDFVSGKIVNAVFENIGNDAIDFSGSKVTAIKIRINGIGDKGISAGESTIIIARDVIMENAELGLVSKDFSFLEASEITLKNVRVAATVFKKKSVFGPAGMTVTGLKTTNVEVEYLLEKGSVLKLEGSRMKVTHDDVGILLYGEQYGKSSK